MNRKYLTVLIGVLIIFTGCLSPAEMDYYQGIDVVPVEGYRPFILQNHNDSMVNSSTLLGNVTVFGFIHINCQNFCPTTTLDMKWIQSQLTDEERELVNFVSITVDPWRDGPFGLSNYMEEYNVSWNHLTTRVDNLENLSLIEQVWTDFSIGVVLEEANNSTSLARGHTVYYNVEHTNGLVIVDSLGYQRVRWNQDYWKADEILEDLRSVLQSSVIRDSIPASTT